VRVGGIIVTWRLLSGERSDRLYAALERGIDRASARMRDPRRMARGAGRALIANVWVLGLIGVLTLAGCTLFGGGPSGSGDQSLTQISWCDRKDVSFRDASASSSTPLTNWGDVKDQLGFTYYLPSSFPKGTCLVLVGGTIHNSVFNGGTFSITYNLPDSGPIAFSESPKLANASTNVQCVQSVQDAKTNICQGVVGDTGVTIAARLSTDAIQNYYSSLKANLAWVPAVEPTAAPSPTETATPKS
jgi:hypothetical protein